MPQNRNDSMKAAQPQAGWRRPAILLLALVLVGLVLRLWFLSVNVIDPRFSAADDGDYYQRALRLAVTGQYTDDSWLIRPPMHVFVFAGLLRLSIVAGAPDWGIPLIRAVQIAGSLLAILIGYDLARRLFNRRAGLIFAALLAIWFPFVELPLLVLSEPLFLFLLLAHLWLLVRWRDTRRWPWLAAAGLTLGVAALTRSPALYATAFVGLFLLLETLREPQPKSQAVARLAARLLVFACAFLLVVGPWIVRNYVVYERFIPVDTLGSVNLWLSLQPERIDGGKSVLARIPQNERQDFVAAEIARILQEDPLRLTRNVWPHFIHVWKAQFAEDFLVKPSFYTRPLRAIWPLGALGDLLWFGFALTGLVALVAPLRDGAFRWLALGWIGYTLLTVSLFHVEPRYLLPIWLLLALYAAAALGAWRTIVGAGPARGALRAMATPLHPLALLRRMLMLGLAAGFLALFFTYRDYPFYIARGIEREIHAAAGARAYAAGDYPAAVRAFEQSVAAHPDFVDSRADLALALLAQGQTDAAWEALGTRQTHRSDVVRGALARIQGNHELAALYFTDAELRAGEDVQALTLEWLRPAPTQRLTLGDGLDFGYLRGFSFGESLALPDGSRKTYRWLQSDGLIALPLTTPLRADSVINLRMAIGRPEGTTLRLTFDDGSSVTIPVVGGQWRTYQVAAPDTLAGEQELRLTLAAPAFIPAQTDPASIDARALSLMISAIEVR